MKVFLLSPTHCSMKLKEQNLEASVAPAITDCEDCSI